MHCRCCSRLSTRALRLVSHAAWIALLVLVMGGAQNPPPAAPSTPVRAGQMDVPLRLIADARQSYQAVQDYTCTFIKRERLGTQVQPEQLIAMKVRTQPFSVYMRWQRPGPMLGQEVCYVTGRNNGMMRAHSTGLLGVVGFISMDPRDPRALETSRHAITEAGIGNLIERYGQAWELENRLNRTQLRIQEYDVGGRRCMRVETVHADNANRQIPFYRSIVYFDKQNHLPIRVENYDWPRPGVDPAGALVESYSYLDLRLNVGLSDAVFTH